MDFAVIKTGGKQYLVKLGQKLSVEKLKAAEGETVEFEALLIWANNRLQWGGKVEVKVLHQIKDRKVMVFKYKPKVRYRRTKGHRQLVSVIEITKIS